jgi:AraC-like DNA-binding protein
MPLAEAALEAGFSDQSHMTRLFRRTFGISPGAYAATLAR